MLEQGLAFLHQRHGYTLSSKARRVSTSVALGVLIACCAGLIVKLQQRERLASHAEVHIITMPSGSTVKLSQKAQPTQELYCSDALPAKARGSFGRYCRTGKPHNTNGTDALDVMVSC